MAVGIFLDSQLSNSRPGRKPLSRGERAAQNIALDALIQMQVQALRAGFVEGIGEHIKPPGILPLLFLIKCIIAEPAGKVKENVNGNTLAFADFRCYNATVKLVLSRVGACALSVMQTGSCCVNEKVSCGAGSASRCYINRGFLFCCSVPFLGNI